MMIEEAFARYLGQEVLVYTVSQEYPRNKNGKKKMVFD